jgi:hypothetical protein
MLADRMAKRDPGNAPASGDRIPYVFIIAPVGQEASRIQGDRVEHPAFVKASGGRLKLDAKYYIEHQLMNPLAQLFSLCVTQMPGYNVETHGAMDAESAASDILFHAALAACGRAGVRAFAERFNIQVIPRAAPRAKVVAAVAAPTPAPAPAAAGVQTRSQKQATIDYFILDKMYLEASKKKKKAPAAATATKASDKKKTTVNA